MEIDPKTGNDYFVAGQYAESQVDSLESLQNVPVTGVRGRASMPLRNLARITRT